MANTKVTSRVLANDAVLTANIADDQVTTAKIADDVALGGNPTTTTQSAGNNTTRIATTAFVTTAVANLADSAPDALNTLNELAAALGDDANFSTTVTNSIAAKLPLAGGTMTGNIAHASDFTIDAGGDIVLDAAGGDISLKNAGNEAGKIVIGDATDGSVKITSGSDFTIDAAGDIILDADGADVLFKDGGTEFGKISKSGATDLIIRASVADKDIFLSGTDGSTAIDALVLDMSAAGKATFNAGAELNDTLKITRTGTDDAGIILATANANRYIASDENGVVSIGTGTTLTGGTQYLTIDSGNVGIGTTNPSSYSAYADNLVVAGAGETGITIASGNSSQSGLYFSDGTSGTEQYIGFLDYNHSSNALIIGTSGAERMRITSAGTFGMGSGSGSLAGSIIINNDGETGTINNAYYNTVLGWEAADDLTTGDSNTIVGNQAGYKLTEATGNTLIGRLAGEQLTTGSYNVAIGYNTMGDGVVTGSSNTAVGNSVMVAVTSGGDNVAVGEAALATLTSGSYNVAVGKRSLQDNTASNNTALGWGALTDNTTGTENVGLGRSALAANTEASRNTAVGYLALSSTTTNGGNNVAIGYTALSNDEEGYNNVGIGYGTAANITDGIENTIIGMEAGSANVGMTTANKNTIIGAKCSTSSNNVELNTVIGYNSTGAAGSDGYLTFGYNQNRTYIVMGNTSWSGTSDSRLKENVADHTLGLGFVNALRPVTYNWKKKKDVPTTLSDYYEDGNEDRVNGTSALRHGFIAQEVKAVMDSNSVASDSFNLWDTMADGTQALAEGELIPILTKAVQELSAKLEAAEARIKTLEES